MRHDQQQQIIDEVLRGLPLNQRLAALCASCLVDNPQASIEIMLDVVEIMSRHLKPEQRASLAWFLENLRAEIPSALALRRWN